MEQIPPQEMILYNVNWSSEMDHVFITNLVKQKKKKKGYWVGRDDVNFTAVNNAIGYVKEIFGLSYMWVDGVERHSELENHYDCFKLIKDHPQV